MAANFIIFDSYGVDCKVNVFVNVEYITCYKVFHYKEKDTKSIEVKTVDGKEYHSDIPSYVNYALDILEKYNAKKEE